MVNRENDKRTNTHMKWHGFGTESSSGLHRTNWYGLQIIPSVSFWIATVSGPYRTPIWISCYWSGENRTRKVYVLKSRFKVRMLWLPQYFHYSIEARTSQIHKDRRR